MATDPKSPGSVAIVFFEANLEHQVPDLLEDESHETWKR
jgi:hypothetical protein